MPPGAHQPAMITHVDKRHSTVDLAVFGRHGFEFVNGVSCDDTGSEGTWHFPERA